MVREFDEKHDFKPDNHPNYQSELKKLNQKITYSETKYHINKLKNNKQVCQYENDYDNLHNVN